MQVIDREDLQDEGDEGQQTASGQESQDPGPFDGEEMPEALRGKSPAEVARMNSAMETTGRMLVDQYKQQAAAAQQAPAQPAQPPKPVTFTEDDLPAGADPNAFNQKMDEFFAAKATPYIDQLTQQNAQMQYQDFFRRYPDMEVYRGEVEQYAGQMSNAQAAQAGNWDQIRAIVLANHHEEIVAAEAQKIAQQNARPAAPSTQRPNGNTGNQQRTVQLSQEEKAIARGLNITEAQYATMKERMNG